MLMMVLNYSVILHCVPLRAMWCFKIDAINCSKYFNLNYW